MPRARRIQALAILIGLVLGAIYGLTITRFITGGVELAVLSWFGDLFLDLLKFLVVPVILTTIIAAIGRLHDLGKLGPLGGRTALYFVSTTFVAVVLGLIVFQVANSIVDFDELDGNALIDAIYANEPELLEQRREEIAELEATRGGIDGEKYAAYPPVIRDVFYFLDNNIFVNPLANLTSESPASLGVIVLALLVGIIAMQMGARAKTFVDFFAAAEDIVIRLVIMVMWIAPIGVFGLAANLAHSMEWEDIQKVLEYMLTVVIGLGMWTFLAQPTILAIWGRMSYVRFFLGFSPALLTALGTSSSAATLPVSMRAAQENLGVSERVSGFVQPLGATLNMNGTALFEAIAVMFIATVFSEDPLSFGQYILIAVTTTIAAIGTVAVPSASVVTITIVLGVIGVGTEGLILTIAVDRILDALRTVTNVQGDAIGAVIMDRFMNRRQDKEQVEESAESQTANQS